MNYRHEFKHLINHRDYALIKLKLGSLLDTDAHADTDGSYLVRSLYFDDYYNHAYNDKFMGVQNRSKYRIRIYNQSENTLHLEKKIKSGLYNTKQKTSLTKSEFYNILEGNYEFLLKKPDNLLRIFYHECVSNYLRPRVVVDYEREPYVMEAGDVRITFDKNVRAGVQGYDIFDSEMPTIEALDPGLLILEVKYTEFLPKLIRKYLRTATAEYLALSKFILCCDKTIHKQFSHF
jgi:hypothetical protein